MIQDIKDRVPVNVLSNDAIRYGIYDEQGNLVRYEYIKREDEPAEEGTPINRALFRNIQGDLHTQDRYNTPIITKDYIPVAYKTDKILSEELIQGDCIPKDWTFSSYDTSAQTATSTSGNIKLYYTNQSGYVNETKNGIKIFDGDESTFENVRVYSQIAKAIIEFDREVKIKKFKLKIQATSYGTKFDCVGSDDNKTYTTLYPNISAQNAQGEFLEYEISVPKYFKYFGIKVSGGETANSLSIYELQVTEYYDNVVFGIPRYTNNLLLPLTSYEVGKIVRIKGNSYTDEEETLTSFENPYININNLGAKQINGTIVANEKYSLVYNGESWDLAPKDYVMGTYTGDGDSSQNIDLGFKPSAIIVMFAQGTADDYGYAGSHFPAFGKFFGMAIANQPQYTRSGAYSVKATIEIVDNGFNVAYKDDSSENYGYYTNQSNIIYSYIAFK